MQTIWIEYAVTDIDRANGFYAAVFGHAPVEILRDDVRAIAILPGEPTISLTETSGFEAGSTTPLAYFHLDAPVSATIAAVTAAGGTLVDDISERPGYGFFAIVADTEGNQFYVHGGEA